MNIIRSTLCFHHVSLPSNEKKKLFVILSIFTASQCVNICAVFKLDSVNTVSFIQANFRKVPVSCYCWQELPVIRPAVRHWMCLSSSESDS